MSPVMFSLKFDHIIYYGGRKITREDVLGWKYGFFFFFINSPFKTLNKYHEILPKPCANLKIPNIT